MPQTASIVSLTEFQSRRAVKDMVSRGAPRQFLWSLPGLGVSMVLGFRPAPVHGRSPIAQHAR